MLRDIFTFQKHNQDDYQDHLEYPLQRPIRIHGNQLYHYDLYQIRRIRVFNKIKEDSKCNVKYSIDILAQNICCVISIFNFFIIFYETVLVHST